MKHKIELPIIYSFEKIINGNTIRQFYDSAKEVLIEIEEYEDDNHKGDVLTYNEEKIYITKNGKYPESFSHVIQVNREVKSDGINKHNSTWLKNPNFKPNIIPDIEKIIHSWNKSFFYTEENVEKEITGLRKPQLGALHAIESHWTISEKTGTIVMPTGTGKTETMISLLVSHQCQKILVIAPTDALRLQIYNKFLTFGILKDIGNIDKKADYPVIGMLKHKPRTVEEVNDFFKQCNVVVTTMNIAGQCESEIQKIMASNCSHLFIDEAHHTGAKTWKDLKDVFEKNIILQFTATPFRNDNKLINGQIIYKYPLRLAQKNGYFKRINFIPVREYDFSNSDKAIAEKAVEQLKNDPKEHILMARVNTTKRAEEVFNIYKNYTEFNPVRIDTSIKNLKKRNEIRRTIINKETRLIVCVDMLGEGFDLPELKIAAFHDIKKSLPITLQLAGRFTRTKPNLGDATFIANVANVEVRDELKKLYKDDPDWNILLEQTSEKTIEQQIDLQEFIDSFSSFPEEIPLQNLKPAMSTVIYKTKCEEWNPENFEKGLKNKNSFEKVISTINNDDNTLVLVTAKKVSIKWATLKDIYNWDWELYISHWDKQNKLLFIHGSGNASYFKDLAMAIAGENVELIRGSDVFRCFSGVNRLKLNNVGLIEQLGKLIRYTMRAGSDVEAGLTEAQKRNVFKSNIFGVGYQDGEKTSIGCSYKGRVWSHRVSNIHSLMNWSKKIGAKIIDSNIDADEILKGTLIPKIISERPKIMPIGIDWSEVIYAETESRFSIFFNGVETPLMFCDINLLNPSDNGDIQFEISSGDSKIALSLNFKGNDYEYSFTDDERVNLKNKGEIISIKDFFEKNPPVIWFADGSSLEGNSYIKMNHIPNPYQKDKIEVWDWNNVNIKKESQGNEKNNQSIQYKVIDYLKQQNYYDVIFDDDNSGESADVVAIKVDEENKSVIIEFYHCKYSSEENAGARIGDLYELCGQAQKSIHWKDDPEMKILYNHLIVRNKNKIENHGVSRFEVGDEEILHQIIEKSRIYKKDFKINIVQPGLSKNSVSQSQLELLGVTENYLMETYQIPFLVIANT